MASIRNFGWTRWNQSHSSIGAHGENKLLRYAGTLVKRESLGEEVTNDLHGHIQNRYATTGTAMVDGLDMQRD
ncbi:hypothetical protein N7539_001587 [Penicillium diatomitis]|uniref:Uncharacterized protein n=1 Tax=Penicillium diatomitis TaxID=2819901 RepID=A0A9W9XH24_9EURO|nr:uncharacterized protein N7539_001587 [Penicillium diatomitis]KAJ5492841.1 hypothetical protein N7539_001587 [Penicillium diatomitis]